MVDVRIVVAEMDGAVDGALSAHQRFIVHVGSSNVVGVLAAIDVVLSLIGC